MAKIIDLSVFQKEDLVVKSLTGEEYHIPGNISTEFYLYFYNQYDKIQKLNKSDPNQSIQFLKEFALEIIKLDESKSPTMETIDTQFKGFNVLMALVSNVMEYINEITSDPNSKSPTSN